MAIDTDRRAKKTALRLEHALLLQPVTTTMSFSSATHSPEVSAHVAVNGSMQIPVDQLQSKPALSGPSPLTPTHPQSSRKRRSSKSKVPSELRQSTSTPHMRNLALANPGELSPTSNKARNKLGYHRTSVACGKWQELSISSFAGLLTESRRTLSTKKNTVSPRPR
jgi:hypothetical protein